MSFAPAQTVSNILSSAVEDIQKRFSHDSGHATTSASSGKSASPQLDAPPPIAQLPEVVQELILVSVDPDTFASLTVLNRQWRHKTDSVLLYAYHLAKCAVNDKTLREKWDAYSTYTLPKLKILFAQQARRNLYPIYRPRQSLFRLSAPASLSSASSPQAQTFHYSLSPSATRIVFWSSSRIVVVDLTGLQPVVTKALAIQQRPTSATVSDDGRLLIILSPEWKLSLHSLDAPCHHIATLMLDQPGKSIALTPDASMLAVSHEQSLEILPLEESLRSSPRRKIACEAVESLQFADNGRVLIGTNTGSIDGSTTVVKVGEDHPFCDPDTDQAMTVAQAWMTQPIFPTTFAKSTLATPVPCDDSHIFAYDGPAKAFGLLDFQQMRFETVFLTAAIDLVETSGTLPTLTNAGDLVAVPFSGSGIQLARLPSDRHSRPSGSSQSDAETTKPTSNMDDSSVVRQRWIPASEKVASVRWVHPSGPVGASDLEQRLVGVCLATNKDMPVKSESAEAPLESVGLALFDFHYHVEVAPAHEIAIDLSELPSEDIQEDGSVDDAHALAMHIQAARATDRPSTKPLARSVTSARRGDRPQAAAGAQEHATNPSEETMSQEERHLDGSNLPLQPAPHGTLQSTSTAAYSQRQRPQTAVESSAPVMRPADGRGEVPDESDADNWVPPPPLYAEDTDRPLPTQLRESLLPQSQPSRQSAHPYQHVTTSTPNLVSQTRSEERTPRSRPERVRTFRDGARNSIIALGNNFKRAFSNPAEPDGLAETTQSSSNRPAAADTTRSSSRTVSGPAAPRPKSMAMPSAPVPRRRTALQRPLSLITSSEQRSYGRSVSMPLERPIPPPFARVPAPESPSTLPSPAQLASLHRRQTSNSISSLRSEASGPPRAAIGAFRRATPSNSPWNSSLMLAGITESRQSAESNMAMGNGDLRGMSQARANRLSGQSYTDIRPHSMSGPSFRGTPPTSLRPSDGISPPASPSRPQDPADLVGPQPSEEAVETPPRAQDRLRARPAERRDGTRRLSKIPSMSSLLNSVRSPSEGGSRSKSRPAREESTPRRQQSKRLQRTASTRGSPAGVGKASGTNKSRGLMSRLKTAVMKQVEKV